MPEHDHPHRRMTDHKLDAIANSSILKIIVTSVMMIATPLVGWALSTVLDRLNKIEVSLNVSAVSTATTDLRTLQLEKSRDEANAALARMSERMLRTELLLDELRARSHVPERR